MVKKAIFLYRQNRYLTLPLCKMDIKQIHQNNNEGCAGHIPERLYGRYNK